MSSDPDFALRADHAMELGEMLEFMANWLATDRRRLGASLTGFCGGGYHIDELRADLARFVFLLGGDPQQFLEDRS